MQPMSSRERMLAAMDGQPADYTPCSFMLFNGLKNESLDYLDFLRRQQDLGLDTFVQIPPRPAVVVNDHYNLHGLPVRYHPDVKVKEWVEHMAGEEYPILVKEYYTPAGVLRAEVRKTEDWRWGDHVPFLDDYVVPRSRKFLVERMEDLDALAYLLVEPTQEEVEAFRAESAAAMEYANRHGLLRAGGWGVGVDMVGWVFGLENMVYAIYDQPGLVRRLLEMIAAWNRKRMQVILEAGVDLYIKRAWYENCDFWSPKLWRQIVAPILQADAALAHAYGARFGYIITSNCMPLLKSIQQAGVDVIMGVDPHCWDLEAASARVGGEVCLWGGINGHLTVEQGTEELVRGEVNRALDVLAPTGRFILSPVDNVREWTPTARRNVFALVGEWQKRRGTPAAPLP